MELALLAITFAWGLSFVVLDDAQRDAGTFGLTALRMTVGLVATLVILRPNFRGIPPRVVGGAALAGLFLALGYLLQTEGMGTTAAGAGGFLTAIYAPMVPLIDSIVRRRAPTVVDVATTVAAFIGMSLIAFPAEGFHLERGAAFVAASGVCWAAQIVVVDRIAAHAEPAALSSIQLAVVAAVGWIGRAGSSEAPIVWSPRLVGEIAFLGFVTCGLGFAVQAWAQRRYSPTRIAVIFSMEPVFAALLGLYFDAERFDARKTEGCLLVAAAVAVTLWLAARRNRASPTGPSDVTLSA